MENKINLVFVTDKAYFKYMLVALLSLIQNTKRNIAVTIFLSYKENPIILNEVKDKFSDFSNLEICFKYFDKKDIEHIKVKKHVSTSAYIKVYLPKLLVDLDKVIYLDSDLIVLNDIGELWDSFSNERPLYAAWNPRYTYDNKVIGLKENEKTFNSGVMLLNLKKMREMKSTSLLLNFIKDKNELTRLNDQAAFNSVFAHNWGDIPLTWNVTYQFYLRSANYLGITKQDKKQILNDAKIIHFTTGSKPWKYRSCHPYKKLYQKFLKELFDEEVTEEKKISDLIKKSVEKVRLLKSSF